MQHTNAISVATATIVGMNAMIGAGIFSAPAALAGTNGIVALCTYVFVIATVWALALSISRLAYLYPQSGSFYTYAYQWGGQYAGVCAVSLYLIGLFIAMGLLAHIASDYIHGFIPYVPAPYIAYGLLATLSGLSIAGAQLSQAGQTVLIICTAFPIIATTCACATQADMSNIIVPDTILLRDILTATKSVIFGFFGFESAASLYQVVRNPEKNVPKALTYSIILVGVLYLAFIASLLFATPASTCMQQPILTDILQTIFPDHNILLYLLNISIVSAIVGTLHAMLWSASALVRATVEKLFVQQKMQHKLSHATSTLVVCATIATAYTIIQDLDTYFSLTVVCTVSAYSLSLITLLRMPHEWRNGHNIITITGLGAASCMMYFALEHLITG